MLNSYGIITFFEVVILGSTFFEQKKVNHIEGENFEAACLRVW